MVGFPGDSVAKNLSAYQCRWPSSPHPGRSHMLQSNEAHTPQLLGLHSRAWKLQQQRPRASATEARVTWSPSSTANATRSSRNYSSPCSPHLEKNPCSKDHPAQPKINKIIFKLEKFYKEIKFSIERCPEIGYASLEKKEPVVPQNSGEGDILESVV